jgi:protein-disulfide isomerase
MMKNAYISRILFRTMSLPLLAFTAVSCSDVEGSDTAGGERLALAAPSPNAFPPAVGGPGSHPREPATSDTIDLRRIGYSRGAEDAPVQVYEFSDFGCPFCGMFAMGTYPALHEEFVATGKVRWTYVPFVMGRFPNGAESARAAECAAEQERFWEMHDLLYEKQNEWKASRRAAQLFSGYAARLGLDGGRFASCYREDRGANRTALNNRAADALRVRATPSFFINGRRVEGALPEEQFRRLLTRLSEAR